MRKILAASIAAVVTAAAVVASSTPGGSAMRDTHRPARIVLIGDSLMGEVTAAMQAAIGPAGSVRYVLTIGTANVRDDWWDVWPRVLKEYRPDAIAVLVGPWEINRDDLGSPEWTAWYGARLERWASSLRAGGARLYWLTAPPARQRDVQRRLSIVNRTYASLARQRRDMTLVDTARALGGQSYRERTSSSARLRRIDGLHLCPAGEVSIASALLRAMGIRGRAGWERGTWATHEPAFSDVECPSSA